jgi:hypothetical protein
MSVFDVFRHLWRSPRELLVRQWNWKSAAFSSLIRAAIFCLCNLRAGWHAAAGAMFAEFAYRSVTAGFYGALTQAFRKARPIWTANVVVMLLLPLASHSVELIVHLLRGTPKLLMSIVSSACFTVVSSLFSLYAMRRGALNVGEESASAADDIGRIPVLFAGFLACGPMAAYRWLTRSPLPTRIVSSGLVLIIAVVSRARSFAADDGLMLQACEKHVTRTYTATAYVTLMSVTIFSRSRVGGGFAALDETGTKANRDIRLRFLSGSTPERAHGLNRLGFIEERIHERNGTPAAINYFGFLTASREASLKEARAALDSSANATVSYVAAEGSSLGATAQYSVRDMPMPARYRWVDSPELLRQVIAKFNNGRAAGIETTVQSPDSQTTETFLYALTRTIVSSAMQSDTRFIHNGKMYRLCTEKAPDERTGEDLQRSGLLLSPENVERLKGTIRRDNRGEETEFRLWFDRSSSNPLPLRFDFRPKSYLRLVFDAEPASPEAPMRDAWTAMLPAVPMMRDFLDSPR